MNDERDISIFMRAIAESTTAADPDVAETARTFTAQLTELHGVGMQDAIALLATTLVVNSAMIRRLKARVAALEAKQLRFCGVWRPKNYAANSLCQKTGGLWLALSETADQPPLSIWRLIVKKGSLAEHKQS